MTPAPRRWVVVALAVTVICAACSADAEPVAPEVDGTAPPEQSSSTTTTSTTASPTEAVAPDYRVEVTSTEAVAPDYWVEVATINVLHGFPAASGCLASTDNCLAPTRVEMLWDMLETDVGCPEIIALQEISPRWFEIVPTMLPELCDGDHVLLTDNVGGVDQEMILTTLPVIAEARIALADGPIWSAHWAQLDAGDELVIDVFATHYASSSFNFSCAENPLGACSTTCTAETMMGDCHPIETLEFLAENAAPGSLQLVIGDLNKEISHERIITLLDAGFVDTHTLAGNPPCPPDGGFGCTSGIGGDSDLDGLDIAEQTLRSRIDFVLARPPAGCALVVDGGAGLGSADSDGDGTPTGVWANMPLDEPVDGLYWASDHAGIAADIGLVCS